MHFAVAHRPRVTDPVQPESVMVGELRGWTQSVAEVGTVWVEGRVDDCYRQGLEIGRSASQDGVPVAVRADVHVAFAHVLDVVDTLVLGSSNSSMDSMSL